MQWLLHSPASPAVADALRRHGHQVHAPDELQLAPDASPSDILAAAQARQWDILTSDHTLAAAPYDLKAPYNRTIVFLQLPGSDIEHDDAIDRLFSRFKRLSPKRLYTLTASRVKIRQLPASP